MNQLHGSVVAIAFHKLSPYSFPVLFLRIFLLAPVSSAMATSGIAADVAAFCAPEPTMPDVGACSLCHSSTNNRGPNDLTAAGMWALSQATYINFR